jgi:predicted GIY-YIG superfamily endonuclease
MVIANVPESLKNSMYYVGMTSDLYKRLKEHNAGRSKFTSSHSPWKIIYTKGDKDFVEGVKRKIS